MNTKQLSALHAKMGQAIEILEELDREERIYTPRSGSLSFSQSFIHAQRIANVRLRYARVRGSIDKILKQILYPVGAIEAGPLPPNIGHQVQSYNAWLHQGTEPFEQAAA